MNDRKYNFIAGLPRSGSTLLSSILNQNPNFSSDISDPLFDFSKSIINCANASVGVRTQVNDHKLLELIRDLFHSYYKNANQICFNTNRSWAAETALLKMLFPDFKMIVCMREIPWILDSFERLHRKNPLSVKPLYDHQDLATVYQRSHALMGNIPNINGRVQGPLDNLKQAVNCDERKQILFLEYDALAQHPQQVMEIVYNFLQEPYFDHDFENVGAQYQAYDQDSKIKDLHTVKNIVKYENRTSIIPQDLFEHYKSASFWKLDPSSMDNVSFVYVDENSNS